MHIGFVCRLDHTPQLVDFFFARRQPDPLRRKSARTNDSANHQHISKRDEHLRTAQAPRRFARQLTGNLNALESAADTGAEIGLLPIRRIGKTV